MSEKETQFDFLKDSETGEIKVGKYSGSERLDPAQFEEPDADNEYMKDMWYEDVWNDPEFHEEMAEMIARYKQTITMTTDPSQIVVHMVGQSHIDVAWKWRYEQTRKKAMVTFRKAVFHAKKFPGTYCFALSEPILLEWIREDYPDLFKEIQEAVKAGGIELVGGSYVEPDVMMPSGEAMVRTRLYGQRYYRDYFGQLADVEWFLDSFGYNYGVPQILVKSGAKYFWTSKITWNRQTVFPFVDFWWQGVDGTQILTTNFNMGYGPLEKWILYEMGRHPVKEGVNLTWDYERDYSDDIDEELDLDTTIPYIGCFFGKGDGGHGPTYQEVVQANGLAKQNDMFKWSRVGDFYRAIEMESAAGAIRKPKGGPLPQGFALARWDDAFTEALLRLLQLGDSPADTAVLGDGRLREVYYAILKGDAGDSARRAFGVGNEIARAIEYLSSRLDEAVTIEDMAAQVGMSRAALHRKFKQATTMSPIQFVKSMRLNNAAMKIAGGMNVNEAAMEVGYMSSSQFSREFKRMYGQSPRQWSHSKQLPAGMTRRTARFFDQLQRSSL